MAGNAGTEQMSNSLQPTGLILQSGSQNPQTATIDQNSIDQMIEDTIFKVTAQVSQVPQPTFSTEVPQSRMSMPMNSNPSNTYQHYSVAESHFTHAQNPSRSSLPSSSGVIRKPQGMSSIASLTPNRSDKVADTGIKNLPQDILHILESDFTSGTAESSGGKGQEISRVAEELRVKARLSRYQHARDQLSDSEDGDSSDGSEETEGSEDKSSDDGQSDIEDQADLDEVDGSGDEDTEKVKNNEVLARLKVEIEQIIGIPEHSPASKLIQSDDVTTNVKHEEEVTNNPIITETQNNCLNKEPLVDLSNHSSELNPNFMLNPNSDQHKSPVVVSSSTETSDFKQDVEKNLIKSLPSPSTKICGIPMASTKCEQNESDNESREDVLECDTFSGPRTAHELKEPLPEVIEVPFTHVSEAELNSITPFGATTSLIGNVLVIQGTAGLGYDRVLDEGTLVVCKNGLVIGKIFETFGSVTSPHYSIRLPNNILASATRNEEGLNLSPGTELYYIPTHSNFVFTSELRAQPKGTDASNLFDEEVHAEEIEFSDDEAEAAYLKACKLARKASAAAKHHNNPQAQDNKHKITLSQEGRKMFVKQRAPNSNYGNQDGGKSHGSQNLNYGDQDGGGSRIESDYSLLERPKGPQAMNMPAGSVSKAVNSSNRPNSNPRSKAKKRGGKKAQKSSSQNHAVSPTNFKISSANFEPIGNGLVNSSLNSNTVSTTQTHQETDVGHADTNKALAPFSLNTFNPQSSAAMMMTQGQSPHMSNGLLPIQYNQNMHQFSQNMNQFNQNMNQFTQNMNPSAYWNGSTSNSVVNNNSMMMPMPMMNSLQGGIPCYNPMMPSINQTFPSSFGYGYPAYNHLPSNIPTSQHHSSQAQPLSNNSGGPLFNFNFNTNHQGSNQPQSSQQN